MSTQIVIIIAKINIIITKIIIISLIIIIITKIISNTLKNQLNMIQKFSIIPVTLNFFLINLFNKLNFI
jgi:hypothetical protein